MKLVKFGILSLLLLMSGMIVKVQAKCECYEIISSTRVESNRIQYKSDTRYPQTIIYDQVIEFLRSKNSMKAKKVLVLGYDGFQEDALSNILGMKQSAMREIMNDGGLYHSFAGANSKQETSTAPGWLSILSGEWAYHSGVINNDDVKPFSTTTFLDEAMQLGFSSTFIASWSPHFEVTYSKDIAYSDEKTIYQQTDHDEDTLKKLHELLADTSSESFDVIFSTLEFTDHAGHSTGYGNQTKEYVGASQQVDYEGYKLLQTVSERSSYTDEDWLILITTDHGGTGTGHGGQSDEEVNTWFATNKPLYKPNIS